MAKIHPRRREICICKGYNFKDVYIIISDTDPTINDSTIAHFAKMIWFNKKESSVWSLHLKGIITENKIDTDIDGLNDDEIKKIVKDFVEHNYKAYIEIHNRYTQEETKI